MIRMMNRNWKGGKAPCSCCCGGPVTVGRAGEKREFRMVVADETLEPFPEDWFEPIRGRILWLGSRSDVPNE